MMNWREAMLVFVLLIVAIMGVAYVYWLTRRLLKISETMYENLTGAH
jgi:Tfp pilus assembly protein PilO